ncbi:MAG: hypothetical protein JWL87_253 [Candidatus Adlerbacteria bacterium]|nr:hypothetical protein [Candidatus Adlerbacteria bacterium]
MSRSPATWRGFLLPNGIIKAMLEDQNKINYFAETNSRGKPLAFGIKRRDRGRHMYVIGKTGMGKSTLLENMAIQDIRNGEGMAFIDPHGSTAERIMEYVPAHRIKDVVYFAPFDIEHPVAFNVMEDVGYDKRHLVVSGLMSAFQKIWEDAWSARMEYILTNTLLALLEYEGATLLDVNRMLSGTFKKTGSGIESVKDSNAFRYKVVQNISDPLVKKFWVDEYYGYTERYIQEATPAIQNKVGQFTSNPLIRNIIGQAKSSFDIRELMDQKKILIINLSKGRVGEVNTNLLGSMLVTKIYLAAMSRADVSAETMKNLPSFYIYVDEFQNFANKSFADILSEARKYKLNLIIAHQYVEQMEEEVRDAVFGNVGTTVSFRVGPFDAETLETVFAPQFEAADLVNLGFAQIYLTLMIDGVGSPPFSATTLPPFDPSPEDNTKAVLAASREQFAKARAEVEADVARWQNSEMVAAEPPKPKYGTFKPSTASHSAPAAPRPAASFDRPQDRPAAVVVQVPVAPAPSVVQAVRVEAPAPQPAPTVHVHAPVHVPPAQIHIHQAPERAPRPAPKAWVAPVAPKPKPAPAASVPRPEPPAPPLEGATSLRDALAAVTKRAEPAPVPAPKESQKPSGQAKSAPVHQPHHDALKETLHRVAPKAEAPASPATGDNMKTTSAASVKSSHHASPPAGLPPEVLREMLAVDELDETRE